MIKIKPNRNHYRGKGMLCWCLHCDWEFINLGEKCPHCGFNPKTKKIKIRKKSDLISLIKFKEESKLW